MTFARTPKIIVNSNKRPLVVDFIHKLIDNKNYFNLQCFKIGSPSDKYHDILHMQHDLLFNRFFMLFLEKHQYNVATLALSKDKMLDGLLPPNVISIAEANKFMWDYTNDKDGIRTEWNKVFQQLKQIVYKLQTMRPFECIQPITDVKFAFNYKFEHAGYHLDHFQLVDLHLFMQETINVDAWTDNLATNIDSAKNEFVEWIDALHQFFKIMNNYTDLFRIEEDKDGYCVKVKSKFISHAWHKDSVAEHSTSGIAHSLYWGQMPRIVNANSVNLVTNLDAYRDATRQCRELLDIMINRKLNARLCITVNGKMVLMIKDISETYLSILRSAARHINQCFNVVANTSCVINLSSIADDDNLRLFINEATNQIKIADLAKSMKLEFKEKFDNLLSDYLGKVTHTIDDYLALSYDSLQELNRSLNKARELERLQEKRCEEKLKLLSLSLRLFLRSDKQSKINNQFIISTVDNRSSALLACFNIPGMVIDENHIRIDEECLANLDNNFIRSLALRAQTFVTCISLLDNVISILCDRSILEKAKTQIYDQGFVFAFRDIEASQRFPVAELLQPCLAERGLYIIPYSACLDANHLIGRLKAALSVAERPKAEAQSSDVIKSTAHQAVISLSSPSSVKSKVSKPSKNKQVQLKAATKKSKKSTTRTPVTNSTKPSAAKEGLFKAKNNQLAPQPEQRGAMPKRDNDGYLSADFSKLNSEQAALADPVVKEVRSTAGRKLIRRHNNAHEGAIEFELSFLECSTAWHKNLEYREDSFDKIYRYCNWFSQIRLLDAIGLRLQFLTECTHVTSNDREALEARAKLLHNNPAPQFISKLSQHLIDAKLLNTLKDKFAGKDIHTDMNIRFYFDVNFKSDERDPCDQIKEVFSDLCEFVQHFDHKLHENSARENEISILLSNELFVHTTDILVFEARAILSCIVKLGELSRQANHDELLDRFGKDVVKFMRNCGCDRNVVTHNNVFNATFDPACLPQVMLDARNGISLWNDSKQESRKRMMSY